MDDEAGFELARDDGGDDLVEGEGDCLDLGAEELEREKGGGERSGDGDARLLQVVERELARGDDHGAISLSDRAAAGHQCVGLLHVGISVEADGGDIVEGIVGELEAGNAHLVGGEAVEHEGIVGVRAVGYLDFLDGCACVCHELAVPCQSGSVDRERKMDV